MLPYTTTNVSYQRTRHANICNYTEITLKLISSYCRIYSSMDWVIISPCYGLSPARRQAISWANTGLLPIGPLGTYFVVNIRIGILSFLCKKMELRMSLAKISAICVVISDSLSGVAFWIATPPPAPTHTPTLPKWTLNYPSFILNAEYFKTCQRSIKYLRQMEKKTCAENWGMIECLRFVAIRFEKLKHPYVIYVIQWRPFITRFIIVNIL